VLRSLSAVLVYPAGDFAQGTVKEVLRHDVTNVGERQGEGIAFDGSGTLWLASEGGGNGRPGTVGRLDCALRAPNE
jgi:hypothetical protein